MCWIMQGYTALAQQHELDIRNVFSLKCLDHEVGVGDVCG